MRDRETLLGRIGKKAPSNLVLAGAIGLLALTCNDQTSVTSNDGINLDSFMRSSDPALIVEAQRHWIDPELVMSGSALQIVDFILIRIIYQAV